MTHLLLLLVILQYTLYFRREGLKPQSLWRTHVQNGAPRTTIARLTLRAEMMCSGAIVFLDSCSHISFASDEIRWMNSTAAERASGAARRASRGGAGRDFTYTALNDKISRILRARQVVREQFCAGARRRSAPWRRRERGGWRGDGGRGTDAPWIIFVTVAFGRERSSSEGMPPASWSDMAVVWRTAGACGRGRRRGGGDGRGRGEGCPGGGRYRALYARVEEVPAWDALGLGRLSTGARSFCDSARGSGQCARPCVLCLWCPPHSPPPASPPRSSLAAPCLQCVSRAIRLQNCADPATGQPRQPQAIHAGAHGQACLCSPKVGARIQGFPRQHGWLYESSGTQLSIA